MCSTKLKTDIKKENLCFTESKSHKFQFPAPDFSAIVRIETKPTSHMSINLMFLCQNAEQFFQYFPWSIRKSPIHFSKHPCHQTIRIISISYVMTFVQQQCISTSSSRQPQDRFRTPIYSKQLNSESPRTTICLRLANGSKLLCKTERPLCALFTSLFPSFSLAVSPPLCCMCILHLTELLPSCQSFGCRSYLCYKKT